MTMFYFQVELIVPGKTQVIIPMNWILGLNDQNLLNYGINQKKSFTVYYSPENGDEPDFSKVAESQFRDGIKCVYKAHILSGSSKYFHIVNEQSYTVFDVIPFIFSII